MNTAEWAILLGILTLVVAAPTLGLLIIQELRARERGDVEWEVVAIGQGEFRVTNAGTDNAGRVTAEMWSRDEIESAQSRKMKPRDDLLLRLPGRAERGPDPVDDLPAPYPRPRGVPVPQSTLDALDRMRRDAEERQVFVKIVWRTRWGVWKSHTATTG